MHSIRALRLTRIAAVVLTTALALTAAYPAAPAPEASHLWGTSSTDDRRGPVSLTPPDGSDQDGYSDRPPLARRDFFPVAVWFESVLSQEDVQRDRAAGINTYLELTTNSDRALARKNGMRVLTSWQAGIQADGYLLPDEVDMWAGPGAASWTGNYPGEGDICAPSGAGCGYSVVQEVMKGVPDDVYVWGQFGKGVMMWESRAEAAGFVNGAPDGVSADLYWFTDPNICGPSEAGSFFETETAVSETQCRRAHNYGLAVDRLRDLVEPRGSKPVWVFVELGHPFSEDEAPTITPQQVRDAVWSGIIHGARGVVYFNHSFGGACQSQHLLRDECGAAVRPTVTRLNRAIRRHARLLNAPFVENLVQSSASLDVSAKLYRGRFYLIVGRTEDKDTSGVVRLRCGGGRRATDVASEARIRIRRHRLRVEVTSAQSVRILRLAKHKVCGLQR